jgi:TPR repeat protein
MKQNLCDYNGALHDHDQAIEHDPSRAGAYCDRGVNKHLLRDFEGAIGDLTQAIALDPSHALAYQFRGLARAALGLQSEAETDFNDARSHGYSEDDQPEDPETVNRRGVIFLDGDGVEQDYVAAAQCFRRAAEQGYSEAQHNLGLMYENGQGVPQDYPEAAKWYRMAAEQGNAGSQNNLGRLCENGDGVTQDNAAAIEWYRKGADNGDANAASNLSRLTRRNELTKYNETVFAFADLMAAHAPLIGDCSELPHSKDTILYAIIWVRDHYEEIQEETEDKALREECDTLISNLNYLLTRLVNDWQPIAPEDKDAIVKLNRCESFPDWALPLKQKYINDEKASKEAADMAIQVILDQVKGRGTCAIPNGRKDS